MPILPSGTVKSGPSAPGSVQPEKATPKDLVAALALAKTRLTSSKSLPASAAAPAILKMGKSPAIPRRLSSSSLAPEAMSSVTTRVSAWIPSERRRSMACPKCRTSPA